MEYRKGQKVLWTGRKTDPNAGVQYWHQAVRTVDLDNCATASQPAVALIGYACDEGIRRNQGRVGAALAPSKIRQRLARLAIHCQGTEIWDTGDVVCVQENLVACQHAFAAYASQIIKKGALSIALGGGHDMAFAHFLGIKKALDGSPNAKIGIINFDAHFDLRPFEQEGNSGTPFTQILTDFPESTGYFAVGIQRSVNNKTLYDNASRFGVSFLESTECRMEKLETVQTTLQTFIDRHDHIYLTIDLDGFSSAYAMGVSAPSPLGFTPHFMLEMVEFLMATKKVIATDIAEYNPHFDHDNTTADLAARLIDYIVLQQQALHEN